MKINYKIHLFTFLLFFLIGFNTLFFYNSLLTWFYNYHLNFSYLKPHFLINMIIGFDSIQDYVIYKLNQFSANYEIIDYIVIIKYIENQLGEYYSFQLFYTLNFLLDQDEFYLSIFQY